MWFASLAFKNVLRRRFRSLLTLAGLALAVGALVSLVGVSSGFERSFVELYEKRGIDLVVARTGGVNRTASGIDEAFEPKIAAVPGIAAVAGGTVDVISFEDKQLFGVLMHGWAPNSFLFKEIKIEGRQPKEGEKALMLGSRLAETLEKKVGDKLQLFEGEVFDVCGIYESFSIYENGAMVLLVDELQRLMSRPNQVTAFIVRVVQPATPEQIKRLCAEIGKIDPALQAQPAKDFISTTTEIKIAKGMAWLTSIVALVIGTVGMLNTMMMSVFERTKEIGILRAIGWRTTRVIQLIIAESFLLSLFGTVAGILGAMVVVRYLSTLSFLAGFIDGRIGQGVILQGMAVGLLSGLLGAISPAVHAARLPPTTAFRAE